MNSHAVSLRSSLYGQDGSVGSGSGDTVNIGKERGAIGAFIGIGKESVGLVTKPVRGILDGGAGAMVALRKVVNGEDASVIPPMTIARALPREQIRVLTDDEGATRVTASVRFLDSAQFAIQMSGGRPAREGIELFHRDPRLHPIC